VEHPSKPGQDVTVDPDAVPDHAVDLLVVALAEWLAETEYQGQEAVTDASSDLHPVLDS
jgi:hypothetical protein